MERIYNTYLKIIKNICTSSDHSVSVYPEDLPALAKLAQEHCTVTFVLPYLRSASVYPAMKQQVKGMMLNYYQIEHFTRLTVSLIRKNNIDCYLLKGLSLADCYPVPEYRKLGDLDLYLADPSDLTRAQAILKATDISLRMNSMTTMYLPLYISQNRAPFSPGASLSCSWPVPVQPRQQTCGFCLLTGMSESIHPDNPRIYLHNPAAYRIYFLYDSSYAEALSVQRIRYPPSL